MSPIVGYTKRVYTFPNYLPMALDRQRINLISAAVVMIALGGAYGIQSLISGGANNASAAQLTTTSTNAQLLLKDFLVEVGIPAADTTSSESLRGTAQEAIKLLSNLEEQEREALEALTMDLASAPAQSTLQKEFLASKSASILASLSSSYDLLIEPLQAATVADEGFARVLSSTGEGFFTKSTYISWPGSGGQLEIGSVAARYRVITLSSSNNVRIALISDLTTTPTKPQIGIVTSKPFMGLSAGDAAGNTTTVTDSIQ